MKNVLLSLSILASAILGVTEVTKSHGNEVHAVDLSEEIAEVEKEDAMTKFKRIVDKFVIFANKLYGEELSEEALASLETLKDDEFKKNNEINESNFIEKELKNESKEISVSPTEKNLMTSRYEPTSPIVAYETSSGDVIRAIVDGTIISVTDNSFAIQNRDDFYVYKNIDVIPVGLKEGRQVKAGEPLTIQSKRKSEIYLESRTLPTGKISSKIKKLEEIKSEIGENEKTVIL